MIRVVIELHRPGSDRPEELGRLEIANFGGDTPVADYSVKAVMREPGRDLRILQRPLYNFDRLRWNILGLLHQSLEALGPDTMKASEDDLRPLVTGE